MHGVLMSNVRADSLHSGVSSLRPYTQHLSGLEYGRYLWTVNVLCRDSAAPLVNWLEEMPDELFMRHYDLPLGVAGIPRCRDRDGTGVPVEEKGGRPGRIAGWQTGPSDPERVQSSPPFRTACAKAF